MAKKRQQKKKQSKAQRDHQRKQRQKEQDLLFDQQLEEYQRKYGTVDHKHRPHMRRGAGSQIDLQIEKSKRKSKKTSIPRLVVRSPDYDTITEQLEEEKTQRELASDRSPRTHLRNALFRGLLTMKKKEEEEEEEKEEEGRDEREEKGGELEREPTPNVAELKREVMPTTETVRHVMSEQIKHSEAREMGMSDSEESAAMEEDEDLSSADKINALKGIQVETLYQLHYAATEQILTLMIVSEVDKEKYRYGVVLEDRGGVVDDDRKQRWLFGVDGSISSAFNRDLCIAVKNGQIGLCHRDEEESAQLCKSWRVVFIDPDIPTRHKYICLERNNKLVLDMGRKGLALRVNKDTNDATQKWLMTA